MNLDLLNLERLCHENNIFVKVGTMPTKIRGISIYYGGKYLVYVNEKLMYSQQQKSTIHELIHIFENHFSCSAHEIDKCEKEVKNIILTLNKYDLENHIQYEW